MGKTKKNNKKGGGIGKSKPEKPHTPPEKTRKNVNFSPSTKSPSSPKQNKTKKMYISRNKERQKAVTKYENRQEQLDLIDMILGKKPLEGGKNKRNRKKRTRRRKRGGDDDANDHTNDCPICITEINEDDKLTTNCNHSFHTSCFVQNCLAELRKDNFSKRDEENKVFQCPNCRGDTKADCLNNPEVRAKYEELRNPYDRLEFQNMIHILEVKLEHTIQQSENGFINDAEKELFLDELYSDISIYNELPYNDRLSNADLGYMLEVFEALLNNAVIEYGLVQYPITDFTMKIRDVLYMFEEHEEHDDEEFMGGRNKSKKRGKSKTKSKVSSKPWKNKRNRKKRTRRRKRGGDDDANDHTNDCPICITEINEDDKLTTNCNHSFHTSCFVQNCLAELRKDNFSKRDEENKVFQCPNCRGDTKADCLNNPEVRAKYEELRNPYDRLEFQNMIHILEVKLEHTIQQSENGFINDAEKELFLDELYSDISIYNELPYNDRLSNADLGYMLEVFEALLNNAVIEYGLVQYPITDFTMKIRDVLYMFEEHEEHDDEEFMGGRNKSKKRGKSKTKSKVSSKPWKNKRNRKKRTRRRKKGGNEEECPICMEHLNDDEKITTECNHDFHRECFIQNCLTELSKGNFKQRDRENKVFQCPNCRGDTKANCLNDPEVRAIYEGLQVNRDNNHGLNFDSVEESEFYHMIEILGDKLENTIQQSENGIISDEAQELFLEELHSDLLSNDDLSDADLGYILEVFEALLENAEIEYDLNSMMVYEFTRKIREELEEFEEHGEIEFMGGRNKSKKGGKSKTKSRRRKGGTVKQGFGLGGIQFEKSTGHKRWEKNPETGEYEAHDQDCYGIGWFKTCKTKSDVSSKPWWSFW